MIINAFNTVILSLCNEQIGKNCCRVSKIRPYINNLNWKNINFPPQEQDYNTLEINKSIALNILQHNEQKISHRYKSDFIRKRENKLILLILNDNTKQHYVAVKNLNSFLKDKNKCTKHFCINCFKKFRTKPRLEKHYQEESC